IPLPLLYLVAVEKDDPKAFSAFQSVSIASVFILSRIAACGSRFTRSLRITFRSSGNLLLPDFFSVSAGFSLEPEKPDLHHGCVHSRLFIPGNRCDSTVSGCQSGGCSAPHQCDF